MDRYYFTMASLPSLKYDMESPFTREAFLGTCCSSIDERDYRLLVMIDLDMERSPGSGGVVEGWCEWSHTLRSELAALRAQKQGRDPAPYRLRSGSSAGARDLARAVYAEQSPSAAEDALLRGAWSALEDLEVSHHFDIEKLMIYFLKVQILELRRVRNKQDGLARFSAIYQSIVTAGEPS